MYIFDNFPHFPITFLAALPPCRHCFHRTVIKELCYVDSYDSHDFLKFINSAESCESGDSQKSYNSGDSC